MLKLSRLHQSFVHALRGVRVVFETEQSFRVQVFIALVVITLAWFFRVSRPEWIILFLLIAVVLVLEMMNSMFERFVDALRPRIHPVVRDIKDIMAATVLLAAVVSAVIGIVILLPYAVSLF